MYMHLISVLIVIRVTSANADPVCKSPDNATEYLVQGVDFIAEDVQTQKQRWTFPLHPSTTYGGYHTSCLQKSGSSQVYVGNTSWDGLTTVIGLESATGKKLWDISIPGGGIVEWREKGVPAMYAMFDLMGPAGGCGGIYLRDHHTGEHWLRETGGDICPSSVMGSILDSHEDYSVFIGDGLAVGPVPMRSNIYRLDASNGQELWTFNASTAYDLNVASLKPRENNGYILYVSGYHCTDCSGGSGNPIQGEWKLNATTGEQIGSFIPTMQAQTHTLIV